MSSKHESVPPPFSGDASPPPPPAEPRELRGRFGGHEILEMLGRGGMGIVYRARQSNPDREVALKILNPLMLSADSIRRFEHESAILARLHDARIAQVFESGTVKIQGLDHPYFSMELIPGRPLTIYAVEAGLDARAKIKLMIEVCEAVRHAHQKGVIHRDLKPGNILVEPGGLPKVLDFGLARFSAEADSGSGPVSRAGEALGTPGYMSPEQARGDLDAMDTRLDVYALGVITYELLCGKLPIDVSGYAPGTAHLAVLERSPAPLCLSGVPFLFDLRTVLEKAMHKDLDRRYESVSAFAEDLRCLLDDRPISARPASGLYRAGKFIRRNQGLVVAATVIAVGMMAGAVGLALAASARSREAEQTVKRIRAENERTTAELKLRDETLQRLTAAAEAAKTEAKLREESAKATRARIFQSQLSLARQSLRQGSWQAAKDALDLIDRPEFAEEVRAEEGLSARFRLDRLIALDGLQAAQELEQSRTSLEKKIASGEVKPSLEEMGEFHLRRADSLQGQGFSQNRESAAILDSLIKGRPDAKLSPGLLEYAKGLSAKTGEEASTHFAAALAAEPFSAYDFRTRFLGLITNVILGRASEAREFLLGAQARYPNDPFLPVISVFLLVAEGRNDEALAAAEEIKRQRNGRTPPMLGTVEQLARVLKNPIREFEPRLVSMTMSILRELGGSGVPFNPPACHGNMISPFYALLNPFNLLPNNLPRSFGAIAAGAPSSLTIGLHGLALKSAGRYAEAIPRLLDSTALPDFFNNRVMVRLALYDCLEAVAAQPAAPKFGEAIQRRLHREMREWIVGSPTDPGFRYSTAVLAGRLGDWALLFEIMDLEASRGRLGPEWVALRDEAMVYFMDPDALRRGLSELRRLSPSDPRLEKFSRLATEPAKEPALSLPKSVGGSFAPGDGVRLP